MSNNGEGPRLVIQIISLNGIFIYLFLMNINYAGVGESPEFFMNDMGNELHSEDGERLNHYMLRRKVGDKSQEGEIT